MAKTIAKKVTQKASGKSTLAKPIKKTSSLSLEKVIQQSLERLAKMGADQKLQDDIKWCLGSYNFDKNPAGLYETGGRALKYFLEAKSKNAKAVPAKLLSDLQKVL